MHDDEDLSALHYAARYNHYQIVKMLIEFGASKSKPFEKYKFLSISNKLVPIMSKCLAFKAEKRSVHKIQSKTP